MSAGRYKGRELDYPRSGVRPTKSMTRLAVFSMLGERIIGARVCDLFAGAGSLGIEALSRGAESAAFVEQSRVVLAFLRRNVAGLPGARVIRGDALRAIDNRKSAIGDCDVVFADPPYRKGLVQETVDAVARSGRLVPGGWLVVEHDPREQPGAPPGWRLAKQGRYGDCRVSILENVDG